MTSEKAALRGSKKNPLRNANFPGYTGPESRPLMHSCDDAGQRLFR
jgi:hypothetical protein